MESHFIPIWKEAPFIRLLLPFMAGIIVQWYGNCSPVASGWILGIALSGNLLLSLTKLVLLFRYGWLGGIFLNSILFAAAMLLVYAKNFVRQPLSDTQALSAVVQVTLEEPLSEKNKSHKTVASVQQIFSDDSLQTTNEKIILYFQKDGQVKELQYGDQLIFTAPMQPIQNAGNPGTFDYKRYCAFQGIHHQVYLKKNDFIIRKEKKENLLSAFLFNTREKVLNILRRFIPGDKEKGLAEALLIGYKDELDKDLVQSYSNTGVVHVIAISGLHLGLIYWILGAVTTPLRKRKKTRWLKPVIILTGLWLFTLLAGAGPSVLRSGVMFTSIVIGENYSRKTSIHNSLAASAFLLLCYDPFWLWDVGFQLSYAALLSIIIFRKPLYNCFFFQNKWLDGIWKLNAVTLSAQILTTPVSIYHFHQFPNLFLITNLLAVPLSSGILLAELLLCFLSFIPVLPKALGWLIHWLIKAMNGFIEMVDMLPFSTWEGLQINMVQLIFLYAGIAGLSVWWLQKNKKALKVGLTAFLGFIVLRSLFFWQATQQQKLIIYNVPRHQAVDLICGRNYYLIADDSLMKNNFLQNFYLKPSRILHRTHRLNSLPLAYQRGNCILFGHKKILIIDRTQFFQDPKEKIKIDIIILSHNPRININELVKAFECHQIVIDGSNSAWKIMDWKKDCRKIGLACHSVVDNGAFVMTLN